MKYNFVNILTGIALSVGMTIGCYGQADTTPPKLVSFSMSPTTVDVSSGPAKVYIRVEATDDLSGVGSMTVQLRYGTVIGVGRSEKAVVYETETIIPQYSQPGDYPIRVYILDAIGNIADYDSKTLLKMGFPSTLTVANQASSQMYTTVATIPHLATGEDWETTIRAYGACADGCTLDIRTYDSNSVVLDTTTATIPASTAKWAKSIVVAKPSRLATGWVEIKATSKSVVGLCASALFTNSVSKQEASSNSSCVQQSGWETGGRGTMQYFYSHLSGYTSGVALLSKASTPITALLEWRDELDSVVASRKVVLLPHQQTSFTSSEAVGKYGRFLVSPGSANGTGFISSDETALFNKSVYSLGFQFSPFGSFTQLSVIN
jgi:hypothetical protein